jgi:hypothetical protein
MCLLPRFPTASYEKWKSPGFPLKRPGNLGAGRNQTYRLFFFTWIEEDGNEMDIE